MKKRPSLADEIRSAMAEVKEESEKPSSDAKVIYRCTECESLTFSVTTLEEEVYENVCTMGFRETHNVKLQSKVARLCAKCVNEAYQRGGKTPHRVINISV